MLSADQPTVQFSGTPKRKMFPLSHDNIDALFGPPVSRAPGGRIRG
ncbi:hypothetical protein [Bauldia sp.]